MHDIDIFLSFLAIFKMAATLKFAAIQTVAIFCENHWVGYNSYSSSNHLLLLTYILIYVRIIPSTFYQLADE
jgi:hypothetical protein